MLSHDEVQEQHKCKELSYVCASEVASWDKVFNQGNTIQYPTVPTSHNRSLGVNPRQYEETTRRMKRLSQIELLSCVLSSSNDGHDKVTSFTIPKTQNTHNHVASSLIPKRYP
jgi:hypothetical protein